MGRKTVLSRLLLAGIVTIFAVEARAADGVCSPPPASLGKFQPAAAAVKMPDVPVFDENGAERALLTIPGRPLVVNFWATWCAPCVTEMGDLDRLAAILAGDGIGVAAVSADREGATAVRRFYDVNRITRLPVWIDRQTRLARALGIGGLPTTILYDGAGTERGRVIGVAKWLEPDTVDFLRRCLFAPTQT